MKERAPNILMVGFEPSLGGLMADHILERWHSQPIRASDYKRGVDLYLHQVAAGHPVDLAIVEFDDTSPSQSKELVEMIHKIAHDHRLRTTPVVAVGGAAFADDARVDLGAVGYITLPQDDIRASVLNAVEQALQKE